MNIRAKLLNQFVTHSFTGIFTKRLYCVHDFLFARRSLMVIMDDVYHVTSVRLACLQFLSCHDQNLIQTMVSINVSSETVILERGHTRFFSSFSVLPWEPEKIPASPSCFPRKQDLGTTVCVSWYHHMCVMCNALKSCGCIMTYVINS